VRDIDQTRLDLLNDGRQLYEILLEEEGSNQKVRHEMGRICGDLGNVNLRLGKTAEAEQNHRNSIQWLAPLVDEVPDEPTFRRDLSITYKKLADLYAATGRAGEALANYRLSLDFKEELARIYPDNAQYRGDLGVGYADLGKSYAASSRPKEAEAAYREALSQLQKLADPEPVHRGNEASCWNQLGSLYHTTGRLKEAEPCYKNALSLWERLTAEHPGNPDYRRELGGVHNNLGFLYIDQKRFIEAIKSLESAKTIRKALVADYPDVVLYQNDLAATHNNLGLAFHNNHEPDKAKEAHQAALQIREPLVFRFPKIIQFRFELAGTYGNIARLKRDYGNQKELEDALQWYEKIPRLLEKDQHNPEARRILCLAHWGRAQTLGRLKRYEESLDHSELALKFDDGRRRVELELGRMLTYVQLGDYVHASENAKDLAEDISLPGPVVYDLACVFSLSFAAALKDSKVAQDEREGLAEPYAIRSIGLLKLAVQRGYKDVDHMKKDSDLDPLRGRKDFKEFIADLESRLKKEVAKASK